MSSACAALRLTASSRSSALVSVSRIVPSRNSLIASMSMSGPASRSGGRVTVSDRSEEHTSELQSLMRISYAVFCLKKKKNTDNKKDKCNNQKKELKLKAHGIYNT